MICEEKRYGIYFEAKGAGNLGARSFFLGAGSLLTSSTFNIFLDSKWGNEYSTFTTILFKYILI